MQLLHRLGIVFLLLLPAAHARPIKWIISEHSSLCVNGSTNINKFACDIPEYGHTDTLTLKSHDQGITLSGDVALKVRSFDCHNTMMTKDLRKTLKEPQFPVLHIRFLSLSILPDPSVQPQSLAGMVDIELAGVTKRCEISYQLSTDDQKVIHLTGTRGVNFSDFGLRPPTKLGGMIRTKDELVVTFQLKMTVIN
jgi:hypothetical protein